MHAEGPACWRAPLEAGAWDRGAQKPSAQINHVKTLWKEVPVELDRVAVTHDCRVVWTSDGPFLFVSLVEECIQIFTLRGWGGYHGSTETLMFWLTLLSVAHPRLDREMVCVYTVPLCAVCAALGGAHREGGRSHSLASEITVTPEDQWGGCSNQATLTPVCYCCFRLCRILVTSTKFVGLLILLTWLKYLKFCTVLKNVIYFNFFYTLTACMRLK